MLGYLVHWLKIAVVIVVIVVAIGWFMKNAATAGAFVGGFLTSIQTFLQNFLSSSPIG